MMSTSTINQSLFFLQMCNVFARRLAKIKKVHSWLLAYRIYTKKSQRWLLFARDSVRGPSSPLFQTREVC